MQGYPGASALAGSNFEFSIVFLDTKCSKISSNHDLPKTEMTGYLTLYIVRVKQVKAAKSDLPFSTIG